MAVTVKVDPIDRDVAVMLAEDLSPAARSATLAEFAREALSDAEDQNKAALGVVPPFDTFVDGSQGKSEDQVQPDGVIVYTFKLVGDVLSFVDQQLIAHSPVKTGRYARSHVLYADGTETDPDNPAAASEYVFLNLQPYARKIEKGLSPAAPEGVYEGVATLAAGRFGNIAKISFTYRSPAGGAVADWAKTASAARHARVHHRVSNPQAWLTNQPAIVIRAF
jgi:N-methylhydantoinase B/oxoprolinase/acetone carboxylase alpha subunit